MTLDTAQEKNTPKQCKGSDYKNNHVNRTRTCQTKPYRGSPTTTSQGLRVNTRIWMPYGILLVWEPNESLQRCCMVKDPVHPQWMKMPASLFPCFFFHPRLCTHSKVDQPFKENSFKLLGYCHWNWEKEEKVHCGRRAGKGEQLKDLRGVILEFSSKLESLCDLQLSG